MPLEPAPYTSIIGLIGVKYLNVQSAGIPKLCFTFRLDVRAVSVKILVSSVVEVDTLLGVLHGKEKVMKILVVALTLLFTSSIAMAHGGGCRKDSLPGKCCHKDHSTGIVHCH